MLNIESIVRDINRDLVPEFEKKLRAQLADKDREWLIEQIVRLTLDAHSLEEMDRRHIRREEARRRAERVQRLRHLALDREKLQDFIARYSPCSRARLIQDGHLKAKAPAKGADLIGPEHRSQKGEDLLLLAKDLLFGLLYGDQATNTHLERSTQELLTLTLPRFKSAPLDFMKASTELSAVGTWQDPDKVSNDARADNIILEVEFGEVKGELVGNGIVLALSLINNLEINEQILYARMMDVEQSTLIE